MSLFPDSFNPRDDVLALLDLCELDTPDGPARFMIGADGRFQDVNGNVWWGSQLISVEGLQSAIGGIAPSGSATLSFFQDPDAASLIAELRAQGRDYVNGRPITFYIQPIRSQAEFYAPTIAPIQWMQRTMRVLTFSASGAESRSITVSFESWAEDRRAARRVALNTEGHARLTGAPNPSLEFMPTVDFEEEKLFG